MIPSASSYAVVNKTSPSTICQNARSTSQSRVATSSTDVKHLVARQAHPRCRREPKTQITAICVHFLRLVNGVNIAWDISSNRNGTTSASAIHFVCISISRSARPSLDNYANRCVASSAQTKDRANIIFPSSAVRVVILRQTKRIYEPKVETAIRRKVTIEGNAASKV